MYSDGNCHLYSLDCPALRDSCPFSSSSPFSIHILLSQLLINILFFQILGESASRATVVVLLDFCFIKLGCYILNIQGSSQAVDLVAYGGYKFVG